MIYFSATLKPWRLKSSVNKFTECFLSLPPLAFSFLAVLFSYLFLFWKRLNLALSNGCVLFPQVAPRQCIGHQPPSVRRRVAVSQGWSNLLTCSTAEWFLQIYSCVQWSVLFWWRFNPSETIILTVTDTFFIIRPSLVSSKVAFFLLIIQWNCATIFLLLISIYAIFRVTIETDQVYHWEFRVAE